MLEFNNIEVSEENILGNFGKGLHVGYSSLINGRLGIGSASLGLISGALNAVINRSRERTQFGKPIGRHQLIQQHISAIRQNLEMARWPVYTAALKKEAYDKNPSDKKLIAEMDLHSALAKRISSRLAFESADRAVQVFGGFDIVEFQHCGIGGEEAYLLFQVHGYLEPFTFCIYYKCSYAVFLFCRCCEEYYKVCYRSV